MSDDRFEQLMSRLLDDELSVDELAELVNLIRDDTNRQHEVQLHLETAEMLAQSEDALRSSSLFIAALPSRIGESRFPLREQNVVFAERKGTMARWALTVATAAVVLIASVYFLMTQSETVTSQPEIATITELNRSVKWIGDGGQVTHELGTGGRH